MIIIPVDPSAIEAEAETGITVETIIDVNNLVRIRWSHTILNNFYISVTS
jgi:hypothetical protein